MIKGGFKKEFYFTNDVLREVSEELGISELIIKEIFNDFIKDFKSYIKNTDYLYYGMNPIGVFSINEKELKRNLKKVTNKYYKETDPEIKKQLKFELDNFKIREKRMLIEKEKFKVVYPDIFSDSYLKREKNAMFKPSKFDSPYYNNKISLKDSEISQNKYAYNWYLKHNKPINH